MERTQDSITITCLRYLHKVGSLHCSTTNLRSGVIFYYYYFFIYLFFFFFASLAREGPKADYQRAWSQATSQPENNAQTTHSTGKRENLGTRLHVDLIFFFSFFRSTTLNFTTNPYNLYTNYANSPTCLPVQLKVVQICAWGVRCVLAQIAWQILEAWGKTCWHIADTKLAHGKNMWQKSYKLYISSTCLSLFRIPVVIDTERFFLGGTIMGTISRTAFSCVFLLSLLLIHAASRPHVHSNAAAVKTDAPIIGSLV